MLAYCADDGFFENAPTGIPCANGFVRFKVKTGEFSFETHDRHQRHRHILTGKHREVTEEEFNGSLLMTLLSGAFRDDPDADAKVRLIEELAGCVALGYGTRLPSPKAVIFYGASGANGKSSIQDMLRGLANPESVCSIPPSKFGNDYYAIQLGGKVLNAVDELGDRAVRKDSFKSAITGEPLSARDLYCSATFVRPVALHVLSTNTLPNFGNGVDGGVLRRLLPIEFGTVIPEDQRIDGIGRRICEQEPDLLLAFAIRGARRLLQQKGFMRPESRGRLGQSYGRQVRVLSDFPPSYFR